MKNSKKMMTVALSVGLSMGVIQFPTNAEAVTNSSLQEKVIKLLPNIEKANQLPSPKQIETFFKAQKKNTKQITIRNVHTKEQFFSALDRVYTELPLKVLLNGSLTEDEIDEWTSDYQKVKTPSEIRNLHTLASYSFSRNKLHSWTITDTSNGTYTAKQIESGLKMFSKEFATKLVGLSDEQKIHVVYNYIFENYQYKANSFSAMMVGNAYNQKLACNGFTRLFYEILTASGVHVKIIETEDHFYNHVQTADGEWVIVDITTDILLQTKHGATGLTKEDYLDYVSKVGFYWAKPVNRETAVASPWTREQKEAFLSTTVPNLPLATDSKSTKDVKTKQKK